MYIADMHCDSLLTVNASQGLINEYNCSKTVPQLQFFASFVPKGENPPEARRKKTMHNLDIYLSERDRLQLLPILGCQDISIAERTGRSAGVFSIEGGGGLFAESEELYSLYRMGLRVLGLAWDTNELAACAWDSSDTGLTNEGVALARRCSELGIILDVSHLSDKSFYDLTEVTGYPLLATHSNFRSVCNSPRNLTDDMAKRLAARGGVIGINLFPDFLNANSHATSEDILRHIDFGLELVGEDHIGFGFDIDGTSGEYPTGISDKASIHDQVIELLLTRYNTSVVEKIAGLNVLRFLEDNM